LSADSELRKALKSIAVKGLGHSIGDIGRVASAKIEDSKANVVIELSLPASGIHDDLRADIEKLLADKFQAAAIATFKKGKVKEDLEFYSVMRSVRAIEHADVCLLLIDATIGIESQDVNIFHLIERNWKGVVVLVNKWDLVDKETMTMKQFEEQIRQRLEPFVDVPLLFVSALTKQRIHKALELAIKVYEQRRVRIPTSKLNEVMQKAIEDNHPPAIKGKFIRIKYVTQLPTHAPAFAFYCNLPQYVREPYKRYLENQIRKHFDFTGVPIRIFMRKK